METRIRKLKGYTEGMVSLFHALEAKHAMVIPTVDNPDITGRFHGNAYAVDGLNQIRATLFLDAIKDCARITFDKFDSSPSICRILSLLQQQDLREEIKKKFCAVGFRVPSCDFDTRLSQIESLFTVFSEEERSRNIKKARDKVVAHSEMQFIDGGYQLRPIDDYNLAWTEPGEFIERIRYFVFEIALLVLDASYAHESFTSAHEKISREFWEAAG